MVKKITLALLSLLLVPLAMMAQSVTISPTTGKLVAAISDNAQETGFQNGLSALWRHEQLPMSLTTSDYGGDGDLTPGGEFKTPTSNMCVNLNTGLLTVLGGTSHDSHLILSLPKGYRFKGYEIVVVNNLNGVTIRPTASTSFTVGSTTKAFVELKGGFSGAEINTTGQMGSSNSEQEYTLARDGQEGEWSNQLYFKITHGDDVYYGLTIKSFKVYFTAEGTFEAIASSPMRDAAKSLVTASFKTNKMDIGPVKSATKQGTNQTFYAYTYNKVRDIDANIYIYQEEAVQDGVPMDVATTKKIYPVTVNNKEYFAFNNGTYYVEAPTQVYSLTGLTYPIGYRVVGAKFTPQWGSQTSSDSEVRNYYYITYTSGNTTYYLNDQLRFTTTKFGWYYDQSTGDIYTGRGDNIRYLSCEGSGNTRTLSFSYESGGYYNLYVFTHSNRTYIGWNGYYADYSYYLQGTTNASNTPTVIQGGYRNAAAWVGAGQQTVTLPGYKPGSFTLNVYGNNGASVVATKTVNRASDAGTPIDLSAKSYGYNNDAIKFQITGLAEGCQALVDVSLFMQALNPYIDKMDVVCHDADNQLSMSQNFDANDFKVSGGAFNFYIPKAFEEADLTFSFENLWSQYGDDTYYTGNALARDGYARYSFVTSPYFSAFDGVAKNKITPRETVTWNNDATDAGLYDARYIGTTGNVQPGAAIAYDTKVYTTKAGNIRFKFNNAENLSNTAQNPPAVSYLEEYPFSVTNYVGSDDPDNGTEKGSLSDCVLNAKTSASDTYYLFTADETRYNIAPSTAWQHRYYAFYRMDINLATQSYDPKLTWTKVYDNTCIWDATQKKDVDKSMWGLKLQTVVHNTNTVIEGYMTVKEIDDAITDALGKDGCPEAADQILYVDGSELYSIINSSAGSSSTMTLADLKAKLATNALFYLPSRTTSTLDNFAYKTSETTFRAGKDIVLTDKQPFYAPFDIQVDIDNKAKYTREVTWEKYGATTKQSLILPFTLAISGGEYSGSSTFKVTKLTGNDLADDAGKTYVSATFANVQGTSTEANTPYLVDISRPNDGTFVVEQGGSLVKATQISENNAAGDYMFYGEKVTAKYTGDGSSHSFTPMGSFSGKIYDESKTVDPDDFRNANVFFYYGSNDLFRSSAALNKAYHKIYAYPFRSFYGYTVPSHGSKLAAFLVAFGEEETNGISENTKRIDFAVQSGKGYLQITSGNDANVRINSLNGMQVATEQMSAGDTRTINLPSGIYIVNGMKVIVK
jgi:hypothetical protein